MRRARRRQRAAHAFLDHQQVFVILRAIGQLDVDVAGRFVKWKVLRAVNREGEQAEIGEEAVVARIAVHVAYRVDMDQQAHARHDDEHDGGQLVDEEPYGNPEGAGDDPAVDILVDDLPVRYAD